MALEATHIRFALDLKDNLNVSDIDRYLSGTIYPDSRYPTGIKRELTHSNDLISKFLSGDDSFRKGWAVHLICDNVQSKLFHEWFPEIFANKKIAQGNDVWVAISAIKTIQDVEDVKYFDIQKYLSCLDYVDNPNDENIDIIREYNAVVQNMYQKHLLESLEQRYLMWKALGISEDILQKIRKRTKKYLGSRDTMDKICNLYNEMLERGQNYISEINQ